MRTDVTSSSIRQAAMVTLACVLAALVFGSDLLARPFRWGRHDWDYYFFMHLAAYRGLTEFAELPLWNPWSMGGYSHMGNPQGQLFSPWFLVHLAIGPVVAFKVVILAHYALCLGVMLWLGRQLGLSRLATVYAEGTFNFSTWLAMRVFAGHYTYLGRGEDKGSAAASGPEQMFFPPNSHGLAHIIREKGRSWRRLLRSLVIRESVRALPAVRVPAGPESAGQVESSESWLVKLSGEAEEAK